MSLSLPDDRLSAYLDGELGPSERAAVDELLAASPEARAELAAITEVKSLLHGLPMVERPAPAAPVVVEPKPVALPLNVAPSGVAPLIVAPSGVAPSGVAPSNVVALTPRRRWVLPAGIAGAAAAAIVAAVVLLQSGSSSMVPDVNEYAIAHVEHANGEMAPMDDDMPADLPTEIGGATLMGAMEPQEGERVHLIYSDGTADISVFAEPGDLVWSELPAGGENMELGGAAAWHTTTNGAEVYVLERGDDVITIVADAGLGYMAEAVAAAL